MHHCNLENENTSDIFRTSGAIVLFHVNDFFSKICRSFWFFIIQRYKKCFDSVPKFNNGKNAIGKTWLFMQLHIFESFVLETD